MAQRLDVFGPDLAQSALLQQRPPLQPGMSGNSHYTVTPHQVCVQQWAPETVLQVGCVHASCICRVACCC
jgi:hypothetical protein